MISAHSLAAEDREEVARLLSAGHRHGCTLMGAFVAVLMADPAITTQQDIADYINQQLSTRNDHRYVSALLSGHKNMTANLRGLAQRTILQHLLGDDESLRLIDLLGLTLTASPESPADKYPPCQSRQSPASG